MKIRIIVFLLMTSIMFVIFGTFVSEKTDMLSIEDNQTIHLKSGEYLFNDIERQVVEHSELIELEYYIDGISLINKE